jgi:hypothetical protein
MSLKKKDDVKVIAEWDVCMLYINGFPQSFVRVNWIWEDEKRGWWRVNLTRLALPLESWTWTLDDNHLEGEEWTMDGIPMQLQILPRPDLSDKPKVIKQKPEPTPPPVAGTASRNKVVSLFSNKEQPMSPNSPSPTAA